MATTLHRPISSPREIQTKSTALLAPLLLLLLSFPPTTSQSAATKPAVNTDDAYNTSVSPALAILVVAIVSAFFLLAFFSIYLRRCAGDNSAVAPAMLAGIAAGRSRRGVHKGLDSSLLEKFPTMVYSSVKAQKLGKESLECAVCLCEFDDNDVLRFLPKCNHVYHRDCIDVWFATHVTCPVCRTNLAIEDEVAIDVGEDRGAELEELVRIGSLRREARTGSVKRGSIGSRSTGDWAAVVDGSEKGERFRLRLPEEIRREIMASYEVLGVRGEGSSRRGYREGVGRAWRSLRLGRSGRWPIATRSFSARAPATAAAEGSVSGEGKIGV